MEVCKAIKQLFVGKILVKYWRIRNRICEIYYS